MSTSKFQSMDDEEFQEADVVWPEPDSDHHHRVIVLPHALSKQQRRSRRRRRPKRERSVPVDIPASRSSVEELGSSGWQLNFVYRDHVAADVDVDDTDGSNASSWEATIPPHLTRRTNEKGAELSVCTGNGRTLKGRDLQRVRNSILRMTGFLER